MPENANRQIPAAALNEKTAATKCSRSLKRTAQRRAVTATLTKKGIPFTDGTRVCKSAKVPTPFTRKIRTLSSRIPGRYLLCFSSCLVIHTSM